MRGAALAVVLVLAGCSFGGDGDGGSSAVDEARYVIDLGPVGQDDPEPSAVPV